MELSKLECSLREKRLLAVLRKDIEGIQEFREDDRFKIDLLRSWCDLNGFEYWFDGKNKVYKISIP